MILVKSSVGGIYGWDKKYTIDKTNPEIVPINKFLRKEKIISGVNPKLTEPPFGISNILKNECKINAKDTIMDISEKAITLDLKFTIRFTLFSIFSMN